MHQKYLFGTHYYEIIQDNNIVVKSWLLSPASALFRIGIVLFLSQLTMLFLFIQNDGKILVRYIISWYTGRLKHVGKKSCMRLFRLNFTQLDNVIRQM